MASILIIDDDDMLCDMMCRYFKRMGHEVSYAYTLEDGKKAAVSRALDVVFLDVNLPDGNGLEALPKIREVPSCPEVIIFTAEGEPDGAEIAIRSGAWDYIEKPAAVKAMTLPLVRALQYREKKRKKSKTALKRGNIVGNCRRLKNCLDLLAEAADSEVNILITGETGTGKELFARAVHENSKRADQRFVVVDCAALPETLVESILFGHDKGAFTFADRSSSGLIRQADMGTLFLDEVGELPLSLQKSFLRVLQERRIRPLGGRHEIACDFRLVAATNRNPDEMVGSGQFRKDLLFRLKSLVIELPPLRARSEDIREIAMHHASRLSARYGIGIKGFSPEFLDALGRYEWPGNIRELVNTLERSLVSAMEEPVLFPKHLPTHIRIKLARASVTKQSPAKLETGAEICKSGAFPSLKDYQADSKRQYFRNLMAHTMGDVRQACRVAGVSRSSLYDQLKKYDIL